MEDAQLLFFLDYFFSPSIFRRGIRSPTLAPVFPLPAVVPDGELARSDVVPARLARKVAPLFGVCWEGNPYGMTWVSDFAQITLTEIGRGAPSPTREEQARLDNAQVDDLTGDRAWQRAGRAVWTPNRAAPTASLSNATMN